ncbi:MAG: VanZ family protein, partial [Saprospiraceae bacterium]|nr:VanZ family protein [Saprospiraceae bacterium]
MNVRIKSLLPAAVWLAVITLLSTKGGVQMPSFDLFQLDKLAHAGAYALLVGLCLLGLHWYRLLEQAPQHTGLFIFLAASGYGALMEVVQLVFFPNRHFEFDDMLANTT